MIAATLSGPTYAFRPNHDESTIEVFESIGDVLLAMLDRHHSKGEVPQMVRLLSGDILMERSPVFGEGTTLTCYSIDEEPDWWEPTEEQVTEVLTRVHNGTWDMKVSLVRDAQGEICIKIEDRK